MMLKPKMFLKILVKIKKDSFDFSNYLGKSKNYNNSNKLGFGKMKDETDGVPFEEYVGLKSKMYLTFVDDSNELKKKGHK